MSHRRFASPDAVTGIVRECLDEGKVIDIEGLGVFRPVTGGGFEFVPESAPRAFLAYADEEYERAARLYRDLAAAAIRPWLDKKQLLPGQNWPRAIERAIGISDFFIPCFSKRAVGKRGQFQSELRYALDCASRMPLEDIFIIPVRLDDCAVPEQIRERYQYVDLFPDWERGMKRILAAIKTKTREHRRLLLAS